MDRFFLYRDVVHMHYIDKYSHMNQLSVDNTLEVTKDFHHVCNVQSLTTL